MDDKKYDSRYDGETTDKILDNAKAIMEQTTAEDGETVQVYDTDGVPHKVSKTELLKKSTLALPKLEDISSFVAINEAGNAVGLMTKEHVASVLAGLMGVGFLEKGNYHDINEVGTYTTYSNTPQAGPFFSIQCGDSCIQESMSYGGYSLMIRSYNHVDGKWNEWKSIAI
ncbi:hypothetical protein [Phocaeicola plebeius]|uniref:hypothetical protein n=1 Tax=Phocaeicola plebeius TaxID=310297 RepID=UPI00291F8670|nr:hypothetical protein AUSP0006_00007 [uncultured phage]